MSADETMDPEAVALFVCNEALRELDRDQRERVLDYLREKYIMDSTYRSLLDMATARVAEMGALKHELEAIVADPTVPITAKNLPPFLRDVLWRRRSP